MYDQVNALWPSPCPPIGRQEAERAARALYRKFGRKGEYPLQRASAKPERVRRCWISSRPSTLDRGWQRLVHDVSHRIHDWRYAHTRRPHDPLHARLELEIAAYVVRETDWLRGGLRA